MIDYLFSLGFVFLGVYRLYKKEPRSLQEPYLDDLRSSVIFGTSTNLNYFVRFMLAIGIFIAPSIRAQIAAITLLSSMWIDAYQYPEEEPTEEPEEIVYRNSRAAIMDIVTSILLGRLLYAQPAELTFFVCFKMLIGFHVFWIGYFGKLDFDEVFWFPDGFPRKVREGEPDLDQTEEITCPDFRYRIIQWIGFALLAGERLIYCFAFCTTCFFVKYAYARHRFAIRLSPSFFGGRRAL